MQDDHSRTYKQMREVLALAQAVYRKLAEFYHGCRVSIKDERVAILLESMQQRERRMHDILAETSENLSKDLLDTYYQFVPEEIKAMEEIETWRIDATADVDEIIDTVMYFDELLYNYFTRAEEMTTSQAAAQVFRNLKFREDEKRKLQVRDTCNLEDI